MQIHECREGTHDALLPLHFGCHKGSAFVKYLARSWFFMGEEGLQDGVLQVGFRFSFSRLSSVETSWSLDGGYAPCACG